MPTKTHADGGLALVLRAAEAIRDELRAKVGATGLRLEIGRRPVPLTISLDEAPGPLLGPLVVRLDAADGGSIATATVYAGGRALSVGEAAAVERVLERHRAALTAAARPL